MTREGLKSESSPEVSRTEEEETSVSVEEASPSEGEWEKVEEEEPMGEVVGLPIERSGREGKEKGGGARLGGRFRSRLFFVLVSGPFSLPLCFFKKSFPLARLIAKKDFHDKTINK